MKASVATRKPRNTPRSDAAQEIVRALERAVLDSIATSNDTPSVRSLARRAGVALGSFYQYFRNREDLLVRVVTSEDRRLANALDARLRTTPVTSIEDDVKACSDVMQAARATQPWLAQVVRNHLFRPDLVAHLIEGAHVCFADVFALLETRHGLRSLTAAEKTYIICTNMTLESLHAAKMAGSDEETVRVQIVVSLLERARKPPAESAPRATAKVS